MSSYSHKVGLPLTAGAVGYVGSKMLYGSKALNTPYGQIDLGLVMGAGALVGSALSNMSHDWIFKHIHISDRLADPATSAVNTGINFASQLAIAGALNGQSVAELDKVKLLAESAAVVVLSDYLYNNFIGPMVLGDDTKATYA